MSVAKKYESRGYQSANKPAKRGLKQKCVYLSPDEQDFIHDFIYRTRKDAGMSVSTSGLVRAALAAFKQLPVEEQMDFLTED